MTSHMHAVQGESSDSSQNYKSDSLKAKKTIKIMYYNARSILPKLDELHATAEVETPDVICITET